MALVLVALLFSSLALLGIVGIVAYLAWNRGASREAGEVIERARQVIAPTHFPRRPGQ